jgi:hypothetical protein
VYLRELDVLGLLDDWLNPAFAPHRLTETIGELIAAERATASTAATRLTDVAIEALITSLGDPRKGSLRLMRRTRTPCTKAGAWAGVTPSQSDLAEKCLVRVRWVAVSTGNAPWVRTGRPSSPTTVSWFEAQGQALLRLRVAL